jgi:type II secretory pathway component PulJ
MSQRQEAFFRPVSGNFACRSGLKGWLMQRRARAAAKKARKAQRPGQNARYRAGERGLGLVSLLVAMTIAAVVLAMVAPLLLGTQQGEAVSQSVDEEDSQVQPIVTMFQSEVNSASIVYLPASSMGGEPAGFLLWMATDAHGSEHCVQWRLDNAQLQKRDWVGPWSQSDPVPQWLTVASGVVNPPAEPPFWAASSTSYASDLVGLRLYLHSGNKVAPTVKISTMVAVEGGMAPTSSSQASTTQAGSDGSGPGPNGPAPGGSQPFGTSSGACALSPPLES